MNNSKNFLIGCGIGFLVSFILYIVNYFELILADSKIALSIIAHSPVFFIAEKIVSLFASGSPFLSSVFLVFFLNFLLCIPIGGLVGVLLGVIYKKMRQARQN